MLLQPSEVQRVLGRSAGSGRIDPSRREPTCLWPLQGDSGDAVAVRLYTGLMPLFERPQPQDDLTVSDLPAEADWDKHAQYLAVRRGQQAFHVQVYSSDGADQHLQACEALARIVLSRLPS